MILATKAHYKRALSDQKEFNDSFPNTVKVRFPDPGNILYFEVDISPDECYWKGGVISFTVQVEEEYPMKPPKVLCKNVSVKGI